MFLLRIFNGKYLFKILVSDATYNFKNVHGNFLMFNWIER